MHKSISLERLCYQDTPTMNLKSVTMTRVKGSTFYRVSTNFIVERAGLGDKRTAALGKSGYDFTSLSNIVNKMEFGELFHSLAL